MRLFRFLLLPAVVSAFDYAMSGDSDDFGLRLTDVKTGITDILTIFTNEPTSVTVAGITWTEKENATVGSGDVVFWTTFVNNVIQAEGNFSLLDVGRELPTEIDAGVIEVSKRGSNNITVVLELDGATISAEHSYESYAPGVSIIPLILVLLLAASTRMVEFSLFSGVFVGACMVAGELNQGFKDTLSIYILEAVADPDHGYVYLFTMFLSGMVGMMEKSGGMMGFTQKVQVYAKTPRSGQFAAFAIGCFIFFDDYANCLLAGETMRPLLDMLCVSREKLAFVVDATAAPIASISPISSWVGYEVSLIQEEIDRIIEIVGEENLTIKSSGLGVFLQSIKYRYYPIFMIVLMVMLIFSQRDYGSMLIAERKTEIYQRKDGGDGKNVSTSEGEGHKLNAVEEDTPKRWWNLVVPVLVLVVLIFYLLVKTGEIPGESQSLLDKIENSNSFESLLWGTMAATLLTIIFYLVQIKQGGSLILPTPQVIKQLFWFRSTEGDDFVSAPRYLLNVRESVESFLYGMGRIFPALIVLTLAWASGAIMRSVGADRLFSRWIVDDIDPEQLPTLSFIISFFMALATGTSWGTMSILFPLILVPTYQATNGDELIFYAVTAGVLSGSVAGDHVSPISDTTVLSALASDCSLLAHVVTQAPYVIVIVIISILFGTVPIGRDAWPNIVGILLGAAAVICFVYFLCVPVLSPTGRYDIFTELYLKVQAYRKKDSNLIDLRVDTIKFVNGTLTPLDKTVEVEEQVMENGKILEPDYSEPLVKSSDEPKVEAPEEDIDVTDA